MEEQNQTGQPAQTPAQPVEAQKVEVSNDAKNMGVLCHLLGGLKNIPPHARRVALLNQVDTPELGNLAYGLAGELFPTYHSIVIVSLLTNSTKYYRTV